VPSLAALTLEALDKNNDGDLFLYLPGGGTCLLICAHISGMLSWEEFKSFNNANFFGDEDSGQQQSAGEAVWLDILDDEGFGNLLPWTNPRDQHVMHPTLASTGELDDLALRKLWDQFDQVSFDCPCCLCYDSCYLVGHGSLLYWFSYHPPRFATSPSDLSYRTLLHYLEF
jgi:hypothetical protein